jgi:hypothetical protein
VKLLCGTPWYSLLWLQQGLMQLQAQRLHCPELQGSTLWLICACM